MSKKRSLVFLVTVLSLLSLVLVPASMAQPPAPPGEVVADGLNNPRGVAFGPEGALYVAEAGFGGAGPCFEGPEGGPVCYGESGSITRVWMGQQERIIEGLPSHAEEGSGTAAIGPHDISFQGRGGAFAIIGLGNDPALRDELPALQNMGKMMQIPASGKGRYVSDVAQYEADENPGGGDEVDSNPYSVLALAGKRLVADAGANALLQVDANGDISTVAVFEDRMVLAPPFLGFPPGAMIPMQSVPNAVAMGPDGAYYVGELTGFPFPVGGANVYRVVPGSDPEVFASGFTNIIDITWGPDGYLYVLEIATNSLLSGDLTGALKRYDPSSGTTEILASDGLFAPGGLAFGPDGALYVSNNSILPGVGQVLRIEP
jgi:hypothetical protein